MCDKLVSLPKSELSDYIGLLSGAKLMELNEALRMALDLSRSPGRCREIQETKPENLQQTRAIGYRLTWKMSADPPARRSIS